ncbi:MAG: uracil-DNA glycosylase [Rectinemataceae bacterium]|nr:uracil-DNA glycosylase [Rectinemataceae bacterium]
MNTEERSELWESLCTVEDWLSGTAACASRGRSPGIWGHEDGLKRDHPAPDFAHAAFMEAAAKEAARRETAAPDPADGGLHERDRGNLRTAGASGRTLPVIPGDSLERIAAEISRCTGCRLAASRRNTVPGQGVPEPVVLVVGEGPGQEEDSSGLPFVGPAGRLLDKMLQAIGLSRTTNCHIANVVKCRPPMNRDPAPDEQAACQGYLDRQIAVLRPRVILCAGKVASQALTGAKDGIGRLRGREFDYCGIPLVATYHPSALLRDESLKRPAWEDLKRLRGILTDG